MSVYSIVVFTHLLGALSLFAALAIEGLCLRGIRAAQSLDDLRTWTAAGGKATPLGLFAVLAILLPGGYLAGRVDAWGQGWIQVALGLVVVIGLIGGPVTGPRMRALRRGAVTGDAGELGDLIFRARASVLLVSYQFRLALALAAVFLMATKPDLSSSLAVVGAAIVLAAIWSMLSRPRSSARRV